MKQYIFAFLVLTIPWSCDEKSSLESEDQILDFPIADTAIGVSADESDQEAVQGLIQKILLEDFKEDISLDLIDSGSRVYKYHLIDLDADGKDEIIVGLTGPYFCGSGGCTMLLLSGSGAMITRFSVVKYPIYVDSNQTNGWSDLILYSGGDYRVNAFDGTGYTSNPSTLPSFAGNVEAMKPFLDWDSQKSYRF